MEVDEGADLLLAVDAAEEDALMRGGDLEKDDADKLLEEEEEDGGQGGGHVGGSEDAQEAPGSEAALEGTRDSEDKDESVGHAREDDSPRGHHSSHPGGGYGRYPGGYRGRGRFLRGPMGLMPHPGRGGYFPPPGPPFGPRPGPPPFMRPPIGFRGPPRHPMMRGPLGPPGARAMMMRGGDPRFRMYGPERGPRPPRGGHHHGGGGDGGAERGEQESSPGTSSSAPKSSGSGPTPLMSIETPSQVKAVVDHKMERERAYAMAARQEVQNRRLMAAGGSRGGREAPYPQPHHTLAAAGPSGMAPMAARGMKRSASHLGVGEGHMNSSEPAAKYPTPPVPPPQSTVVRSNLRQIQCVDEPMAEAPSEASALRPLRRVVSSSAAGNNISLTHNPRPARITIDTSGGGPRPQPAAPAQRTGNGNLVSIPLVGSPSQPPPRPQQPVRPTRKPGCRVVVSNLPATATFEKVSQMTTQCGSVRTIQFGDGGRAVIEFAEPAMAEKFYKQNNKRMVELSILTVARLAN